MHSPRLNRAAVRAVVAKPSGENVALMFGAAAAIAETRLTFALIN